MALTQEFHQVYVFVPPAYAEQVKAAMFSAGAGRIGNYDSCAWEVPGTGQFKPLGGSQPFLGEENKLSREPELRIELVCPNGLLESVLNALVEAHPYEEPAYGSFPIWTISTR